MHLEGRHFVSDAMAAVAVGLELGVPPEAIQKSLADFKNLAGRQETFQEYGFTTDIILEAVNRTINRIHTPSFEYADRILQDWKSRGVRHVSDIQQLPKPASQTKRSSVSSGKNAGNFGFPQRDYDFDKLEQQLLDC